MRKDNSNLQKLDLTELLRELVKERLDLATGGAPFSSKVNKGHLILAVVDASIEILFSFAFKNHFFLSQ